MAFNIWNNLDEIALYLGLERLDSETNESFYNRIRQFGRWKYRTDYYTQVHSIPLQLALETNNLVKISSLSNFGRDTNYTCKIDWEYFTLNNSQESIRVFIGAKDCKLSKILTAIENSNTFTYKLYDESAIELPCKFLIRNTNIKTVDEYIASNKFRLDNKNLLFGSVKAKELITLKNEKEALDGLKITGDFFVDYKLGYIEFLQNDFTGGFINYKYYDDSFCLESTDINLIPLNNYCKYGFTDEFIEQLEYVLNDKVWG
jgi:hypothetical protein